MITPRRLAAMQRLMRNFQRKKRYAPEEESAKPLEEYNFNAAPKLIEELEPPPPESEYATEIAAMEIYLLLDLARANGWHLQNPARVTLLRDKLLQPVDRHRCSAEFCEIFSVPHNVMLTDYNTGTTFLSSGCVYICKRTGQTHICSSRLPCTAVKVDPARRNEGYCCAISGIFRYGIVDMTPEQDKDTPISVARIDKMRKKQNNREMGDNYEPEEGDMSPDCFEGEEDVWIEPIDPLLEETAEPLAKRQKRTPLDEAPPEERIEYFMQSFEKNRMQCRDLVYFLTSYATHLQLWLQQLEQYSEEAHDIILRWQRRAKNKLLSACDYYNRWAGYVLHKVGPQPKFYEHFDTIRYVEVVCSAWRLVITSPHVAQDKATPNFSKIALAVLYTMSTGGYVLDCSLPSRFKHTLTLNIILLPNGAQLAQRLLKVHHLESLDGQIKGLQLRKKHVSTGMRLLRESIVSWLDKYQAELLAAGESESALQTYQRQCNALHCGVKK